MLNLKTAVWDSATRPFVEMKLLAVECATERCSVALWLNGEVMSLSTDGVDQRNSESLLPMVGRILEQADLSLKSLDALAFGAGPGAFTGLRVACGVAQGLAFGADLPVVAVGSLEIMAEGLRTSLSHSHDAIDQSPMQVLAVLDARMGEVYSAQLISEACDWCLLNGPQLSQPEDVKIHLQQKYWGVGDGFALHQASLTNRLSGSVEWVQACLQVPDAVPLVQLAAYRFQKHGGMPAESAQPVYVRDKIALTSAERAAAK